jgi:hypothetical protein
MEVEVWQTPWLIKAWGPLLCVSSARGVDKYKIFYPPPGYGHFFKTCLKTIFFASQVKGPLLPLLPPDACDRIDSDSSLTLRRHVIGQVIINAYVTFQLYLFVLISPTVYARLFLYESFARSFLYLSVRFVLFWSKNIGAKSARNMLVKLTPCDFWELFSALT